MNRRHFCRVAVASSFVAVVPGVRAAGPLLFHEHGHGLAFSSDGKILFAPSHDGLAAYEDSAWREAPGPEQGFSGFAVAERAIYASGPGAGLMRSVDGGRTWHTIALRGEEVRLIAAGYRSGALYALKRGGLAATLDEGKTWRAAKAQRVAGEIHALGAHPMHASIVALGTGFGLYLSRDGGETFNRLDGSEPVTALTFDHDGSRVLYARALSNDVIERRLDKGERRRMRLPALAHDYVTCLAHSPTDERSIAFATRKLDVYLTRDGGGTWRRIASAGDADVPETETQHEH
ncbi:MAG TPA: hypothetical protein VIV54_13010 [Burkholderiales bacterium]